MGKIKTFYFVNHSHTDIGFTDYQDVAYRQHIDMTPNLRTARIATYFPILPVLFFKVHRR